jgi:hypothetical protein
MNQTTCPEPSKKHHEIGDLTDNLVPDIVVEQGTAQEYGNVIVLDLLFLPPFIVFHFILALMVFYFFLFIYFLFFNIVWRSGKLYSEKYIYKKKKKTL